MTLIRSRLIGPDGAPRAGITITALIYAIPPWLKDKTACIVGRATARTGRDGWWQLNIIPYTEIEGDQRYTYVEITEHLTGEVRKHWLRVPDSPQPMLMRDLIVRDPQAMPPWRPMPTLGLLSNVDHSADGAPAGTTLVFTDGMWRPGNPQLRNMSDVDALTLVGTPKYAPLVMLGHGKWGVRNMAGVIGIDPADPTNMTVRAQLSAGLSTKTAEVDWGDGTPTTPIVIGQTVNHQYTIADWYFVSIQYTDLSEDHTEAIEVGAT